MFPVDRQDTMAVLGDFLDLAEVSEEAGSAGVVDLVVVGGRLIF
jgi:hypothetical protein